MRRLKILLITLCFLGLHISNFASNQNELKIWKEFVQVLLNNEITLEKIRPSNDAWKKTIMGWLTNIKNKASIKELEVEPEIFRVGKKVHFILPLSYEAHNIEYCFTFLTEGDEWYFHALEAIFIRLDKISSLPTSEFPDITEEKKAWDREEWRITKQVRLFNFLSKEKGKDFAFNWFKDGHGYFLASQMRVPFVSPSKAFILYLCWYQANLRGNIVKLLKLEDDEAIVEMELIYFHMYRQAAHLKNQISFEDYQKVFESIWYDRVEKAGWNLKIEYLYDLDACIFYFTK